MDVTYTPPATPPPWRPKGYPPGTDDDPTLVEPAPVDPTVVQPVPIPPPPPPPPGPPGYYRPAPMGYPPPVRPGRRWLAPLLACAGAFLGVVVVAALLSPKDPAPSPPSSTATVTLRPTTTVRPTTTRPDSGPGSSADQPAPVGTAVEPAKGWTVTVTKVDADANAKMAKAAWYLRPGSGKRYVLVTLEVTHQGEQKGTLFAEMKFAMRLPDGATVGPMFNPMRDHLEIGQQLPPQGTKTGTLAFELPKGDVAQAVLLAEPMFTLDGEKDQRFLALD